MVFKLKRLLSAVCFCLIVLICISSLSALQRDDYQSNWTDESAYPYQVLWVGSSHIYRTIIPQLLYNDYGLETLSVSTAGQTSYHALTILEDIRNLDQYDLVVLDVFAFLRPYTYSDDFNHSLYTTQPERIEEEMRQNRLTISSAAIRQLAETNPKKYLRILGEKEMDFPLQYFFSLFNSHSQYLRMDRSNYEQCNERFVRNKNYDLGLYVWPLEDPFEEELDESDEVLLNEQCKAYLLDIIKLCQSKGVTLLLTAIPYHVNAEERMVMRQIEQLAQEHGVDYLSMETLCEEAYIDWSQDFMDIGHTNHYGALKLSDYFGWYLSDTYHLEDRSADPLPNSPFLQSPDGYETKETLTRYHYDAYNLTDYLETLYNLDDNCLLLLTANATLPENAASILETLGFAIPEQPFDKDFALAQVISPSQSFAISTSASETLYTNVDAHTLVLQPSSGTIEIDHQVVSAKPAGNHLVIFDLCDHSLVDSIAFNEAGESVQR